MVISLNIPIRTYYTTTVGTDGRIAAVSRLRERAVTTWHGSGIIKRSFTFFRLFRYQLTKGRKKPVDVMAYCLYVVALY